MPLAPFDTTWGRSSYTSWTQASHSAAPEALEEGRETDALARELEVQPGDDPGPLAWPEDGPLASFPRGAQAGDCLHRILEQIDFRQSVAHQSEVCARELQRAGIAALHNEAVLLGLEQLLATPFGGELGGSSWPSWPRPNASTR